MGIGIKFSVILLLLSSFVYAQEIFTPPVKPNNAFKAGENLTYQLRYGLIVGGTATLSLSKESYDSKPTFYARAVAQTTGLADKLYGVRDVYESWFDPKTNMPYKQVRDINEGKYTKYNEVTYNRENNTVKSKLSGEHPVPPKILDLTSTFYYLRRVDYSKVKEGDVLFVNMYFGDEIFPFRLVYRGKETIRTKFGKIDCLKICPVVEVGRMFKRPDDLTIWFSDDDNRIPVSVEMDIRVVGKIHLKLMSYENTVNPMVFQQ